MTWGALALAGGVLLFGVWTRAKADVETGRRLAENNCGVCHDMTAAQQNKKGPFLWGVVNRPAGVVDFAYSAAFLSVSREKPFVWDVDHLGRFISDPAAFIPMTRMAQRVAGHPLAFEGMESAANRRDLIAYLGTLK
ncbi:MAG: c-type cytochrome [Magnetococcus sp. YQC-3]